MARKYESMMEKAEWNAPTNLKVGDVAVVLHSYAAKEDWATFTDVDCGDTTVVEIKKNGTVILANKFKFHKDGYGHSTNNATVLSDRHAIERNADGSPVKVNGKCIPATTLGHSSTF